MPEKKQQKREDFTMIITTTPSVEGRAIREYKGIAFGEVITGVNFMKDLGAGLRNFFGGRSAGYEEELQKARGEALAELEQRAGAMGANAVIGVDSSSCAILCFNVSVTCERYSRPFFTAAISLNPPLQQFHLLLP